MTQAHDTQTRATQGRSAQSAVPSSASPAISRTFRRVFVWFDLLFGSFTGAYIYGRIYFHKNSPNKSRRRV